MYFAQATFQRRVSSMRFSWSAREGWGLTVNAERSPLDIRRMKSVSLRCCLSGSALQLFGGPGSFSLEHRPKVQKFKKECGHNANRPQAHIVALVVDGAGLLYLHKPASFSRAMARSQRRWPMPESRAMVRMSMSMKPFSSVGVPRQSEARSSGTR